MEDNNIHQPLSQPAGLGGWLTLVGIGVIVSPFLVGFTVVSTYLLISSGGVWEALTSPGSDSYHPYWGPLLISEIVINCGLMFAYIYLIYMFSAKWKKFPVWFTGVLLFSLCFQVWGAWVVKLVLPDEPLDPETVRAISRSLISCFIWIPYMRVSKRVKATFVQ